MTDREGRTRRAFLAVTGATFTAVAGCSTSDSDPTTTTDSTSTTTRTTSTTSTTTTETTSEETTTTTEEETTTTTPDPEELALFNGEKRVFVVNGYSSSHTWPDFLQRKIDRYFEGGRPITVEKAVRNNAVIANLMNPDTGERKDSWQTTVQPALDQEVPVVTLAQQTLTHSFSEPTQKIYSGDHTEAIERGTNVFERYVRNLRDDGSDLVYLSTHIYKEEDEPITGNERLALGKVLERDITGLRKGPDVWEPTKQYHPTIYRDDNYHPNEAGAEVMAHFWFKRLLRSDDRTVPSWSASEMKAAVDAATEDS